MADVFSPAWFVDNTGMFFWIFIMLIIAYHFYTKRPLEKPAKQMIKEFGRETFLNKNRTEIEVFLEENADFSDVDFTEVDLAKEIYIVVNGLNPKRYEREQNNQ